VTLVSTFPGQSPFAPVAYKEPAPAKVPDVPPMMRRLIDLGISQGERELVRAIWTRLSDAERLEAIEAYENLDDDELRVQISEMRDRLAEDGISIDAMDPDQVEAAVAAWEQADAGETPAPEVISGEQADADAVDPEDVPDDSVPVVLDWVGEDRGRAAAALIAEQRRHDPPRKTLVDPLSALVG
jgi:hypothetical protein